MKNDRTEKRDLKHLRRIDLLELLLAEAERCRELEKENRDLKKRVEELTELGRANERMVLYASRLQSIAEKIGQTLETENEEK